ncbi:ABC transporter permease [Tunturibacter empetritectus]|uniref:Permease n=1 Tax=Tunturiibacter empetritectus TaxID=3069691 RepID=A0A7W8IJL3_9BACT|nr:ABC transporter permease [Edaphobacter lichenicola]MBB5318303.1 putative permease [Edaphobacter lichenicola]
MNSFLQDLRFSLRQIRRSPGFMVTAVLTLALGVGANTAIFSLLDQALLRSLPVRSPEQLVVLSGTGKAWEGHSSNHGGGVEQSFSYPMYRDLRDKGTAVFDGLIATAPTSVGITRDVTQNRVSELVDGEVVSGNYFSVLGVKAAQGRLLTASDDTVPGGNPVAVLSYAYWQTHMGSDANVAGETISINGAPFVIAGVAAPEFQSAVWGQVPDLFVPMSMLDVVAPGKGKRLEDHTDRWMNIVGRLKPGETPQHAQMAIAPLWHALRAEELKALGSQPQRFVDEYLTRSRLLVAPGSRGLSYSRESLEKPLYAVMGMAFLVLLIAAVNVASLLLVRSAARVREFSLRYALGASARRVVQQLLLEGVLIGIVGGMAGLLIAPLCLRVLVQRLSTDGPTAFSTTLDARLLAFNFAIAVAVSVLFSLAPAVQLLRPDIVNSLKQQTTTASGGTLNFRSLVVSLQVGLSVLLLVGSGLFVRTMQNLRHVDTGINTSHLITFHVNPLLSGYAKEKIPALHQQILETMAALPGVQAVGATNDAELADTGHSGDVTVEGFTAPPDEDFRIEIPYVSANFFHAMQESVLAGRSFSEDDDAAHPLVGIVNETFAKHYFTTPAAAVGRRVVGGDGKQGEYMTIVGVTRDAKHGNLRDAASPTLFSPMKQAKSADQLYLYLRTATRPEQSFAMVRQAMKQIDPGLAVDELRTMDEQIDTTLGNERMIELLAISFGLLATMLAGVGLYGVLAFSTTQRTREIGIRIALGSTRLGVSRLVLADVLRLAGIGIVLAIPCSVLLARLLRSQLFGVSSADPLTLAGVILLIAVVAVVAAIVPARRASSVHPTTALRAE